MYEIARRSDLNLLCAAGSELFEVEVFRVLSYCCCCCLLRIFLRSCVLVSLWFFCKHTRELGFPGLVVGVFFYYDVHFFLFVLTSCCTWLVMNSCTGVRVGAATDDL